MQTQASWQARKRALAKNLLTGEASYKCPSSSAVARHYAKVRHGPHKGPFLRCRPTISCLTEAAGVGSVSLIDTLTLTCVSFNDTHCV
jgi:hypothetical protein